MSESKESKEGKEKEGKEGKEEKEEGVDVCEPEGFKKLLEQYPELLILVTEKECNTCPSLRETAYKLADEKALPLAELEFKKDQAPSCTALDRDIAQAAGTGVLLFYKNGKLVDKVKATGFKDMDEKAVKEMLEKAGVSCSTCPK